MNYFYPMRLARLALPSEEFITLRNEVERTLSESEDTHTLFTLNRLGPDYFQHKNIRTLTTPERFIEASSGTGLVISDLVIPFPLSEPEYRELKAYLRACVDSKKCREIKNLKHLGYYEKL
jgi:hypothetical protein